MYERILVPLDGSKVGEAALPYVEELVSKLLPELKAEVTLFQAVSSLAHYVVAGEATAQIPYTEKEMEQIKRKAMDYLNKAGEGLRSKGAIVKIKVGIGSAADGIIKAADEINAGLIAMSTHGRSGLSRWAFGSVTDKILRGGNTPVLVVRAPTEAKKT
ncbi:hypothetical protein ES703_116022 [subsurface metagenome]